MTTAEGRPTGNGFRGPRPFGVADRAQFFAREELAQRTAVLAMAQRLLIVHGASGAGKTSLLRAGVVPRLVERGATVLPRFDIEGMAVLMHGRAAVAGAYWQAYLQDRLGPLEAEQGPPPAEIELPEGWAADTSEPTPSDVIASAFARAREGSVASVPQTTRVLVIDQIQDLFVDRSPEADEERAIFSAVLQRVLSDDRRLHVVLVVDDSYLSAARALAVGLEVTAQPVLVHVPQLTQVEASDVVGRTARSARTPVDAAKVVRAAAAATAANDLEESTDMRPVDPILLQTVAWRAVEDGATLERELNRGTRRRSRLLAMVDAARGRAPRGGTRLAHLDGPLRELYGDAVAAAEEATDWDERRIRRWSISALISALGTRAAVPLREASPERPVLEAFARVGLVESHRGGDGETSMQLAHDRLVPELLASNRGFLALRPVLIALRGAAVLAALLLVGALILGGFGITQYQRAEDLQTKLDASATPMATASATATATSTASPPAVQPIAISRVLCAPTTAFAGDVVQCSAGYSGVAAAFEWFEDEAGSDIGENEPVLLTRVGSVPARPGEIQPRVDDTRRLLLTLRICSETNVCAMESDAVDVRVRLSFDEDMLEVGTSAELTITNLAPVPTEWRADVASWLTIEPAGGLLAGGESAMVVVRTNESTPVEGGATEVVFSAGPGTADADALVAAGQVRLTVRGLPQLQLPADLVLEELESGAGRLVTFSASATDEVDQVVPVVCSPASGSLFEVGSTLVACSATNSAGLRVEGSFGVVVLAKLAPPDVGDTVSQFNASCALFIAGQLEETTCEAVAEFWESQGKPDLAAPYRAAAEAEAAEGS